MTTTTAPTVNVTVDGAYGSHEVLDRIRATWVTFDHVGAHFQGDAPALAANLRTLSELAGQMAAHVIAQSAVWEDQDREAEASLARYANHPAPLYPVDG